MANEIVSYSLNFKGYWREINKSSMPNSSGIYLVYRCAYNSEENVVLLKSIIYIGQAINVRERIANHDRLDDFKMQLESGEELCYSFAEVSEDDLDIVENALIFAQKPVLNSSLKNTFNYDKVVSIKIDGRCTCMKYTDFKIS